MPRPLSIRPWLLSFSMFLVAGCTCQPKGPNTEDSGDSTPTCVTETDCALGQSCIDGHCMTPTVMDGSTGCTTDAEKFKHFEGAGPPWRKHLC